MSIRVDRPGQRYVVVTVDVFGTPETVWRAIATGVGISAWFVPTDFEFGFDGIPQRVFSRFGPGMDSVAEIREWAAPHHFRADSSDLGEDAPSLSTLWTVEAIEDERCRVSVEHSVSTESQRWDEQLRLSEAGWPDFFKILILYLDHYAGKRCAAFALTATTGSASASRAWEILVEPLGLSDAAPGERCRSEADAPVLAGIVESAGEGAHPQSALLKLDEPGPGTAHLFAMPMQGQVYLSLRLYFYGEQAAAIVSREEPMWQAWLSELFPEPPSSHSRS